MLQPPSGQNYGTEGEAAGLVFVKGGRWIGRLYLSSWAGWRFLDIVREREREGRCRNHGVYWVETPSAGGDDGMAVDRK